LEGVAERGYGKDAFNQPGDGGENEATAGFDQQLAQFQEFRDGGGGYEVDAGEIDYQVALMLVANHLDDGSKLVGDFQVGRQADQKNVIRPILKAHLRPPSLFDIAVTDSKCGIGRI
jgi:hypothetical protein